MNTAITDHKIEKPLGPSGVFAGYSLIVFGIIGSFYSLIGLIVVIPGCLLAFTYDGTRIDFKSRRIKNYTRLFGLFRIGKWYSIDDFSKFKIYQSKRTYTSYSRANIPLNLKTTDIRLSLLNDDGSLKILVNRFDSFESARKEMSELIRNLQINELKEWI
jgi:hypothetical protein